MRKIALATLMFVCSTAMADNFVQGYMRSDGTYVAPHYRSEQNTYRMDNYSSQGNTNPYSGQRGSQRNELSDTPTYNPNYGNPNYNNPYRSKSGYRNR